MEESNQKIYTYPFTKPDGTVVYKTRKYTPRNGTRGPKTKPLSAIKNLSKDLNVDQQQMVIDYINSIKITAD